MPRIITLFTVWLSSPGDTKGERDRLGRVIDDINRGIALELDLRLELKSWENLISTLSLEQALDSSIDKNDIFIGIVRGRIGTRLPPNFGSLTALEYEFRLALDSFKRTGTPRVLIYINNTANVPLSDEGMDERSLDQLRRVSQFKTTLRNETFVSQFGNEEEFARQVHRDVARFLANYASSRKTTSLETRSVFISYARQDAELVSRLVNQFATEGIRTWYDTSQLTGGDDWVAKIAAAIEDAEVFLLVASQITLGSRWVRREVEFADSKNKPIIPIEVGQVRWPNWFELEFGGLQRVTLETGTKPGEIEKLLLAIRRARRV